MQSFYGKTAVVTGAASGIGRAIAKRCAQYDMRVVLADIDQSALNKTENDLMQSLENKNYITIIKESLKSSIYQLT